MTQQTRERSNGRGTATSNLDDGRRAVRWEENRSLVQRAVKGDKRALDAIIRMFIPDDERVISSTFLGTYGWFFRERSFFAVTDRRAVSIHVGPFRFFDYRDGLLEHINGGEIVQPSRGRLYLKVILVTVFTLGIGLLFAPLLSRRWYRRHKAGLRLHVREGLEIPTYVDAKSLPIALFMYRHFSLARDDRLAILALSAA